MPQKEDPVPIKVIDIIVERNGYILLVKRGDFWILPGGEIKEGQSELACLEEVVSREIKHKISGIFKKLDKTVTGISLVRHGEVEVTIYVGDITANKMSEVKDCNAHWFGRQSIPALRLSTIAKEVLEYYFAIQELS